MEKNKNTTTETKPTPKNFNVPAYIVFVIVGIYFLVINDFSQAVIYWGIGLVFDPFEIDVPFYKRSVFKQAVLYIHLLITYTLFVIMLLGY